MLTKLFNVSLYKGLIVTSFTSGSTVMLYSLTLLSNPIKRFSPFPLTSSTTISSSELSVKYALLIGPKAVDLIEKLSYPNLNSSGI